MLVTLIKSVISQLEQKDKLIKKNILVQVISLKIPTPIETR